MELVPDIVGGHRSPVLLDRSLRRVHVRDRGKTGLLLVHAPPETQLVIAKYSMSECPT